MRNVTRVENHPRISWCWAAAGWWGTDRTLTTPSHARTSPNVGKPQTQGSNHRPKRKVFSRKRNLQESHVYMIDLTAQIDTLNCNEYTISHLPDQDSACCYHDQRNCFLRLPQVTLLDFLFWGSRGGSVLNHTFMFLKMATERIFPKIAV